MKYRITPLNTFCVVLIVFALVSMVAVYVGGLIGAFLWPFIIAGFLLDFAMQQLIPKYYIIVIVEVILIFASIVIVSSLISSSVL